MWLVTLGGLGASLIVPASVGARGRGHGATNVSTGKGAGLTKDGLTVTLTAQPARVKPGQRVRVHLSAHTKHAQGALLYSLSYGDGTSAPTVMIPQYCLGIGGRPASVRWRFSHRYRKAGRYRIVARVAVNCGGPSVRVAVQVHVR